MNTISNNELAKHWDSSEMTLAAYAAQGHVPLGATFELTPRCNFKCKMCYVRLDKPQLDINGRELTAKEWISLAEDAANEGTLNVLITGGEPLIRDDFEEIYTAMSHMGFVITLNTNAALMNYKLLKLFQKYPPTATNITLYGACPETYGKICGNPVGFNQTLLGLDMLSEVPTVLDIRTTFIKDNMHELDELREIANRYTRKFAINVTVYKPIRGAVSDAEISRLTPAQMGDISEANAKFYRDLNTNTEAVLEKNMDTDNYIKARDFGFNLSPEIIPCLAAKSLYWITWDGKMLPCGSFCSPYTLPLEEGFKSAWDRLPTLFESISLPLECTKCEYADGKCSNCPAILQTESGSFDKVSPYICDIASERSKRKQMLTNNGQI